MTEIRWAAYEEHGVLKKLIQFNIEAENKNPYRARVSLQCFCDTEINKGCKLIAKMKKLNQNFSWYNENRKNKTEIFMFLQQFQNFIDGTKIEIITVNSIWEMYKEIGYDYKTKKYLENSK